MPMKDFQPAAADWLEAADEDWHEVESSRPSEGAVLWIGSKEPQNIRRDLGDVWSEDPLAT